MHRFDETCHWCGVLPKVAWQSPAVWRSAAAVLLSVALAASAWRYGSPLGGQLLQRLRAEAPAFEQVATSDVVTPAPTAVADSGISTAAPPMTRTDSLAVPAAGTTDSITWTPAVARTWVNVRNDASRGGDVIGVIKPAARAMLGTDRSGWRQVRSPNVNGWVDPRLFAPDSLRTRGE